uniref:C-type lectin domain-containing protein n=1 Tax=Acrobeloides nanus TaxID=290746 RepID=A0A914EP14_9BILA
MHFHYFFASLLYFIIKPSVFADCPASSIASQNSGNSFCFQLFQIELEFVQAVRACNDLNGNLASICDAFTNEQLRNAAFNSFLQYDDKDFWLGLMNNGSGPSTNGNCAAISISTGKWSSSDCNIRKPFICSVPQIIPKVDKCPYDYVYFDKTGFCYKKIFNKTFGEAIDACLYEGAKLVSIHSDEENQFLILFNSIGYPVYVGKTTWIGLQYSNHVWNWVDGTNFNYTSKYGFFDQQYNNTCAYLWPDPWNGNNGWKYNGAWENGWNCSMPNRSAICKMSPPN